MDRFVDLVLREADGWTTSSRASGSLELALETVFVGGGTPSLLPLASMQRLLVGLRQVLDLGAVNEWTVECNPATVSAEYCGMLRECSVDRLSFGAQSFDREELKLLERHHEPEDVRRTMDLARGAGIRRVNIDLIYAIPGQSAASWARSLDEAVALEPEHISCYALTYEPNTPLAVKQRLGTVRAVGEQLEIEMMHHARRRLASAGYRAYEISNYARMGEECRQNLLYWNGGSYIGLGPAAASHIEGWRWRNQPHLGAWERAVEAGGLAAIDVEHLTARQRAGELAMLQLRLADGVRFDDFQRQLGIDARQLFREVLQRLGRIGMLAMDADGFRLTEQAISVADSVAAEFVGT